VTTKIPGAKVHQTAYSLSFEDTTQKGHSRHFTQRFKGPKISKDYFAEIKEEKENNRIKRARLKVLYSKQDS